LGFFRSTLYSDSLLTHFASVTLSRFRARSRSHSLASVWKNGGKENCVWSVFLADKLVYATADETCGVICIRKYDIHIYMYVYIFIYTDEYVYATAQECGDRI